MLCCAPILLRFGLFMEIKYLFIFPKVAAERPNGIPPFLSLPACLAWLPRRRCRAASILLVGFLLLGMPPPSAVRTACFVRRGIMSQHNLPPVEKRHVLPRGEKESILLSSINLELALFFSLYHFSLPTTISFCAFLHLQDPFHPAWTATS